MTDPALPGREAHTLGAAAERLRGKWLSIAVFGALLTAMGVASLVFAFVSTLAMVTLNGLFLIIGGLAEIGVAMHARRWGPFFLWGFGGIFYILVGEMCLLFPGPAAVIMTLILGAGLIAAAVVRFALALQLPGQSGRAMVFLAALVTFSLGLIIVLRWPLDSVYVMGALLGVDLLFHGAGWVVFGIALGGHRAST